MPADFIPDSQFIPDATSAAAPPAPTPQAPPTAATPDFIPESQFQSDEDKYGSLGQQAKTLAEGAGEAATFGLSTGVERAFGVKPEDIRGRRQENPLTHVAGQGLGLAATALIPGAGEANLGKAAIGAETALEVARLNPFSASSIMTGVGEAAVKALGPAGESIAANIARSGIKGAAETALLQSGDEISKMISQDPNQSLQTAATNIGLSGLLGAGVGGALGSVSPLWKAAQETKVGKLIGDFRARAAEYLSPEVAQAAKTVITEAAPAIERPAVAEVAGPAKKVYDPFLKKEVEQIPSPVLNKAPTEKYDPFLKKMVAGEPAVEPVPVEGKVGLPAESPEVAATPEKTAALTPGAKLFDALMKKGLLGKISGKGIGAVVGGAMGHLTGIGGGWGAVIGEHALGSFFDSVLPSIVKPLIQTPISAEALKSVTSYGMNIVRGAALTAKAADSLFDKSKDVFPDHLAADKKQIDKLDERVKSLGDDPSRLLGVGGSVGHYLPEHSAALGQTAANAVNYLNSQRPKAAKLGPLDKPIDPTMAQKAAYKRTLEIAEQPLMVLQHIRNGTLTSKDVQDLHSLYPDLYKSLGSRVYSSMLNHVAEGGSIPFSTRIGVSLFLGSPVDPTLKSEAIQAAQATFMMSGGAGQQQGSQKSGDKKPLSKLASMTQTPSQAREQSKTD